MQNLGGQTECIKGNWKIENRTNQYLRDKKKKRKKGKEKTNSGYKHNNKVSHGIFNLAFRLLQHTSSELTVTKYDEI